jgi:UMP-CMP kinase
MLISGDLLAQERDREGSEHSKTISECRKNGVLVPIDILLPLLQKAMDESGESNFLIDGFPRNDENLTGWNASPLTEKVSISKVSIE